MKLSVPVQNWNFMWSVFNFVGTRIVWSIIFLVAAIYTLIRGEHGPMWVDRILFKKKQEVAKIHADTLFNEVLKQAIIQQHMMNAHEPYDYIPGERKPELLN